MFVIFCLVVVVIFCVVSFLVVVEEVLCYNQVLLYVEVSQQVVYDLMQVIFYSENQGSDLVKFVVEIISVFNVVVVDVCKVKGVIISLGSCNSYLVYDDKGQKIIGWCECVELCLESFDFVVFGQFFVDLLGKLKMGGMDFSIVDVICKKNED